MAINPWEEALSGEQQGPNEYDEALKRLKERDTATLRLTLSTAAKTNPDQAAKTLGLADRTKLPPDLVGRNLPLVQQKDAVESHDFDAIFKDTPKLAGWLTDPNNAAVAHDDLPQMGWLESKVTKIGDWVRSPISGALIGSGKALSMKMFDILNRNLQMFAPENAAIRGMRSGTLAPAPLPFSPGVPPPLTKEQRGPWWSGPANVLEATGSVLQKGGRAAAPPAERQGMDTEILSGVGQLVPLIAASITGGPVASATMLLNQGTADMADEVAADNVSQARKDLAALAGGGIAAITGETGLNLLLKRVPVQLQSAILSKAVDLAAAGGIEAFEQFTQTLLNGVTQKVLTNPEAPLLPDIGKQMGVAGGTGVVARLLLTSVLGVRAGTHFKERQQDLADLGAGLKESKTFARAPQAVQEFIARATADGPAEHVYLPVEKFNEYFAGKGINPQEAAAGISADGAARYQHAIDTGADIQIPFADYAVKIAATDHATFFNNEVRFNPDEANFRESQQFGEEMAAEQTAIDIEDAGPVAQPPLVSTEMPLTQAGPEDAAGPLQALPEKAADADVPNPKPTPSPLFSEKLVASLDTLEAAARERIQKRGTLTGERLGAGLPIDDLADIVVIGAAKLAKAGIQFADWSGDMIRDFGEHLRPHLEDIYSRSMAMMASLPDLAGPELEPVFATQEQSGQSDANWKAYQSHLAAASDKSRGIIEQKLLGELQRERNGWWIEERDRLRDDVSAEVHQQPEYVALSTLQSGTLPDGTEVAVEMKLDLKEIKKAYGAKSEITDKLKSLGVARLEGGVGLDVAAERLGFTSGQELAQALIQAPKMQDSIDIRTDAEMNRRHGNKILDGTLPEDARKALLGSHRDEVVRAEMRALRTKQQEVRPFVEVANERLAEAERNHAYELRWAEAERKLSVAIAEGRKQAEIDTLKEEGARIKAEQKASTKAGMTAIAAGIPSKTEITKMAADLLGKTTVRDLRPDRYWTSAAKASKDAVAAVGKRDYAKALEAKQRELLNLEMYRQANDARDDIQAVIDQSRRMFRPDSKIAAIRNMDYVEVARAIAAHFFFPEKRAGTTEALRRLRAYDPERTSAIETEILMANAEVPMLTAGSLGAAEVSGFRPPTYKRLTLEQFSGVRDLIDGLWATARRDQQLLIDGRLVSRQESLDAMSAKLNEYSSGYAKIGTDYVATGMDQINLAGLSLKAQGRRAESWVAAMDGGNEGPFRTHIWNPVKEAIDQYRIRKVEEMEKYNDLLKPIEKTMTSAKIAAPEIGYTFNGRAELLGALLHAGNRDDSMSNLSKLLRGRKNSRGESWGSLREDGSLDATKWDRMIDRMHQDGTLTKADYDFVQGVWDLFEGLKPGLQKAHREMEGTYFAEVPASSLQTPFGEYRGGYVPAKADPLLSPEAQVRNDKQSLTETGNSYALPSTGRGATKARIDVAVPLAMNLSFIPSHIDWALRFTEVQPRVKDVSRILFDRQFRSDLGAHDPAVVTEMLVPWLQRAATQRSTMPGMNRHVDAFWTAVRTNSGMQVLTASINNGLQQATGLFVAATKVPKARLGSALWEYVHSPARMAEQQDVLSPFMRTFETNRAMEIQRNVNETLLNPGVYAKTREWLRVNGQILAQTMQGMVNRVAWQGAFDHAISEGHAVPDAVRQADSVIRQTQGSFFPEDISRLEAGTPFIKAITMFSGYFNMQANLHTTEIGNTLRSDRGLLAKSGQVLSLYTVGFMLPAVVSQAIANSISGHWGDDDDSYLEGGLRLFFGSQWNTAAAMVPGVGQLGKAGFNAVFTDSSFDDDIKVSPWAGMIGNEIRDVAGWAHGKGNAKTTIKDTLSILGVVSKLPLGPLGKPLGYLMDLSDGKVQPKGPVDVTRGLVTGRQ